MRRFRFLDWLDAATDHPVARVLKGVVAALILASVLRGCYEVARETPGVGVAEASLPQKV